MARYTESNNVWQLPEAVWPQVSRPISQSDDVTVNRCICVFLTCFRCWRCCAELARCPWGRRVTGLSRGVGVSGRGVTTSRDTVPDLFVFIARERNRQISPRSVGGRGRCAGPCWIVLPRTLTGLWIPHHLLGGGVLKTPLSRLLRVMTRNVQTRSKAREKLLWQYSVNVWLKSIFRSSGFTEVWIGPFKEIFRNLFSNVRTMIARIKPKINRQLSSVY